MKRLEAVFLTNVILYIESFDTITKLIQVNKKCQEATKILRYFNKRKFCEGDERGDYRNYGIVNNIFDIFPNIETIRCQLQDILNNVELFEKVKQIELIENQTLKRKNKLHQGIKDKIIRLDINCFSLEDFRLNEFPNVRKVKFGYSMKKNIKELLGNNDIKLKLMIMKN